MKQSRVYALDFDGVICDSAIETGISAWKTAKRIWLDMHDAHLPQQFVEQFRDARPLIETGYESVFVMRMMFQGKSLEYILANFRHAKPSILEQCGKDPAEIKQLFGETRDKWINDSLQDWIDKNSLFPGISEKLQTLSNQHDWYIVTTKQERFVAQIFAANGITLAAENIYGMDRKISKEEVLIILQEKHPEQCIHFVEDRVQSLVRVKQHSQLNKIKLFFANWGYSTKEDKQTANQHAFSIIELDEFLAEFIQK